MRSLTIAMKRSKFTDFDRELRLAVRGAGRIKLQVDALYFDNSKFREGGPINTIVEREQRKAVFNCMRTD